MRALELKIPPGIVVVVIAALMWLASTSFPTLSFRLPANRGVALAFVVLGLTTAGLGVIAFRRARTTVNPLKPGAASSLVTIGVYRWTRNPMYLGMLLALTGCAFSLSNALAFLFLPVFVLYLTRFQIHPEERALTSRFGEEFAAYQSKVRRWL